MSGSSSAVGNAPVVTAQPDQLYTVAHDAATARSGPACYETIVTLVSNVNTVLYFHVPYGDQERARQVTLRPSTGVLHAKEALRIRARVVPNAGSGVRTALVLRFYASMMHTPPALCEISIPVVCVKAVEAIPRSASCAALSIGDVGGEAGSEEYAAGALEAQRDRCRSELSAVKEQLSAAESRLAHATTLVIDAASSDKRSPLRSVGISLALALVVFSFLVAQVLAQVNSSKQNVQP
eukprot:PhM_4_TR1885/c0_g1_i1/m.94061